MAKPRALSIPEEVKKGFMSLFTAQDETFEKLATVIKQSQPRLSFHSFITNTLTMMGENTESSTTFLMQGLISLSLVLGQGLTVERLVEDVCQTLKENESTWEDYPEEEQVKFKKRLSDLLDIESLRATAKAGDVMREHQNIFGKARILTDIRPIFGEQLESDPIGAVIVQTLKLHYHNDNKLKEFFVAMDEADVDSLLEALNRAKTKRETLKLFIKKAKILHIELE